jgi:hypothetical protein
MQTFFTTYAADGDTWDMNAGGGQGCRREGVVDRGRTEALDLAFPRQSG